MMESTKGTDLHALVDMGSNGIRFSISDLSPPTTRILPTIYQDRAGISLYDAQFKPGSDVRQPISDDVQRQVISRLLRFRETCLDFGVPKANVMVLATEATRLAPNSVPFRERIKDSTGWDVQMIAKDDEGRIGALGVASSLANVEGLVMDLGGGSMQITWMAAKDGVVRMSPRGSVSLPYGAAELTRRLAEVQKRGGGAERELEQEMFANFQNAYHDLEIPDDMFQQAKEQEGLDLYLCGGGFRGWGYLLMGQSKVNPYPIPIMNGFKAHKKDFQDTLSVTSILSTAETKIFRISERRASQVPAVAFLINTLMRALPLVKDIRFCQGGVREGFLFQTLPPQIRSQDPLLVTTMPYRTPSSDDISSLLQSSLPATQKPQSETSPFSDLFTPSSVSALANILYVHSTIPKDTRPAAALHCSTTGLLASAHGLSHEQRALLSLVLYERWSGDLSLADQSLLANLCQIVSIKEAWWCRYLGVVASLVGDVYPAGVIRDGVAKIALEASLESKVRPKKGGEKQILKLVIKVAKAAYGVKGEGLEFIRGAAAQIEKVGKKKNWIRAGERVEKVDGGDWGLKVDTVIEISG